MDKWIPYQQLPWNDMSIPSYHIDTRDFKGIAGEPPEHVIDLHKTRKYPHNYFYTVEEIVKLLDRYSNESGGLDVKWRMFSLTGTARFRTSNWQLKYIRIYRTIMGFVVYDSQSKFLYPKDMLNEPIEQEYLNSH